jgi:hypothetical protein
VERPIDDRSARREAAILKNEEPASVVAKEDRRLYRLDATGALFGDDLLSRLTRAGYCVRRYGDWCSVEGYADPGDVPPMPLLYEFSAKQQAYAALLRSLGAADMLSRLETPANQKPANG